MQAILELILTNPSEYPVVMVLTDLGNTWRFFWLERRQVVSSNFDLHHGVSLLQFIVFPARLLHPPLRILYIEIDAVFETLSRTKVTQHVRLQQRLRGIEIDVMDMLPKDDVADMHDVYDVMTPLSRTVEICNANTYDSIERGGGRMGIDVCMSNFSCVVIILF